MEGILIYYRTYPLELMSLIAAIACLIILFRKETKTIIQKHFSIYLFSYIILCILAVFNIVIIENGVVLNLTLAISDYLFTIYEFYIFSIFLKPFIPKNLYQLGTIVFYSYCPILIYLSWPWHMDSNYLYLQSQYNLQAIILLIFISYYYLNIFKSSISTQSIFQSFYIVTGLTFFLIATLPFTLISHYLLWFKNPVFNSLFNIIPIFYSILFLSILLSVIRIDPIAKR